MKGPVNLTNPSVGIAVLFLVSILALVLMLTIRLGDAPNLKPKGYHSEGFDFGSFKRDMFILIAIAIPFIVIFFLKCL
ncbi:hypothetical protein [Emticicia sp. BO119]|uniref:hypothetical protein n=1 Tax=Emticicia sp. BO119 TaxID=2757768 RepID=UPI0015F0D627|nr:hypothetical protein [Emticicia sp. BO119]MBA4852033.1 hypothetical protein [Emticicia sp. BO119]